VERQTEITEVATVDIITDETWSATSTSISVSIPQTAQQFSYIGIELIGAGNVVDRRVEGAISNPVGSGTPDTFTIEGLSEGVLYNVRAYVSETSRGNLN
jgi:hypothetical protein